HLHTVADELRSEEGQPRDIAARPRKTADEPTLDGIRPRREDDGNGAGHSLGGQCVGSTCRHDDGNVERNEPGRKGGEPVELPLVVSGLEYEVATFSVTEVTKALKEDLSQLGGTVRGVPQPSNARDRGRRLRLRGDRGK